MTEIYLDNSATTRPYREIIELINRVQAETYGNPSSMHKKGLEAEKLIGEARRQVAAFFSNRESEVVFTSGGTEANNLAIKGAAYRNRRRGGHLVTTSIEHPSVLNCFRFLEQEGFSVTYLPVDEHGLVNPGDLKNLVGKETTLVSIMHVNSEIGSIQPLGEIGQLIKKANPDVLFHIDAVQSFARLPLKLKEWSSDMISCSAHKIHGPRGAGSLWIKEGTLLQPLIHGGGQEKEIRPGTENTAAIAGFGLAVRLANGNLRQKTESLTNLKLSFYNEIQKSGVLFTVNGPTPEDGAPHILNLSFPGLKAELLLHSLEEQGIYVSAGSACHSRRPDPSHVLKAIGLSGARLESALRFSFSTLNTEDEVVYAAHKTAEVVRELSSMLKNKQLPDWR